MFESKSWYDKTANKNVKGAKAMGFIKNRDQNSHKFNFGHFFSSLSVISLCLGGDDKEQLGESFAWEASVK